MANNEIKIKVKIDQEDLISTVKMVVREYHEEIGSEKDRAMIATLTRSNIALYQALTALMEISETTPQSVKDKIKKFVNNTLERSS